MNASRILHLRPALPFWLVAWIPPMGGPGGTLPRAVLGTKAAGVQVPVVTGGKELGTTRVP